MKLPAVRLQRAQSSRGGVSRGITPACHGEVLTKTEAYPPLLFELRRGSPRHLVGTKPLAKSDHPCDKLQGSWRRRIKIQRIYRDAKIIEIYEGTTEIEKMIVAKGLLA